ncbi:ABC transporter ATP-binding protein [Pollutimonas bauzanensis]|uniref:Amino acid/amide ABC transporter ATP-binding protein 1, HAAT family n=1 Tax=Pollutimonas bauzanensis TaxID=658167 RepID=A0A1M5UUE5_9BURK|nr:ABC transporter ATP-binding protein [Pollutimonas bauzanensis]SHH66468.1 amino acid/amide ABC transporter ATP-binding protein 1, HAAT family [Pollutimonas bauzanensis]
MLEVRNLTVKFAGLTAVDDLSFTVNQGEVFTLMGPNGAGKTTAFNAIGGFVRPTAGHVALRGQSMAGMSPAQVAALGIRRTFQNNGILREMSVLENVLTGLELSTRSSFWGCALGAPGSARAERDATRRAREMLGQMDIAGLADRPAGDLSFGQQRLVEIARAMVAGAELIMLDEPAVGLSPGERLHLGQVLRELTAKGMTVLLVEHVQDLVMAVSDQILVLNYGKKIAQCPPSEVRNNKDVLEVYLGHA